MTQETVAPVTPAAALTATALTATALTTTAQTTDAGRRTDNRVWIRAVIYIAVTHFFAGFVILLFELGSRK